MKDHIVERLAISVFEQDEDNFTIPWEAQPARVRSQTRRSVRKVLTAIHICSNDRTILDQIERGMS